ncbi:MBL fold metallo-hydrolase [Aliikangiella coralliicola]|uniref:Metallo-beta-lactamase domain-containing protein n=1 Tax=Aliikangiella coralliicola TaxID=2592383 RepID=A0A545UJA6_9GAMM|nr:MBL fold metallo-hydrolase [Aliikangiella coralliicola]TQV89548.1 hypothetical protein FLL46_01300 [Aliikangiella coralliicola]
MRNQNSYLKRLTLGALIMVLTNFNSALLAGDRENRIINKAVEAYGGDRLTQLQSLSLTDKINHYSQWQSGHSLQGPMITYLSEYRIELTVDLINKRKVFKQATARLVGSSGSNVPTVTHRVFTGGKGYAVDHALLQYQPAKNINYGNTDMGNSQLLDPLIIRQLSQDRSNSEWTDIAYIQGEAHDVLSVNSGTDNEYVVYLNQKNGYLTRLLRKRGPQFRSYDFLEHRQTQGITWAKQLLVSTAKKPIYHTDSRKIRFNSAEDRQFNLPSGYKLRPKTQAVDVSQLTFRQLAKGVYFVGQDWAYTLFIDAGEYYISAGAWGMDSKSHIWQKGLDLLRQKTGSDKPVGQHIVTHHHHDHMMGLSDVLKQGVNLVIHPSDIPSVQQHLPKPLADDRFVPIAEKSYLADGKVMLIDVPNSHANHNLAIYLPEHKLLFTEDMFGSSFQKAFHSRSSWPSSDTYHRLDVLTNKLNQLELEVDQYVSSHHARILNQDEIDEALKISRPSKETLLKRLFFY